MRRRRQTLGVSAIELVIAIAIVAIAAGAVGKAFSASLDFQTQSGNARDRMSAQVRFEDRMTRLIQYANLTGTNSYFISPVPLGSAGLQQDPATSPLGPGSASLVLTTWGESAPLQFLASSGRSFEDLNRTYGPQAGNTAVAFSTVPVGVAGNRRGLFLREQKPAGSDPKQGGTESVLDAEVSDIRFEFYDGTNWVTEWDTSNGQKGTLPSAVRVTYILQGEKQPHEFFVSLSMTGAGSAAAAGSSSSSPNGNQNPGGKP